MKVWMPGMSADALGGPFSFRGALAAWLKREGHAVAWDSREPGIDVALAISTIESPELRRFKWRRIPVVQRLDGVPFNTPGCDYPHETARVRHCYDVADAVIFQSGFSKDVVQRSFGPPGCVSRTVYNGVDLDRFASGEPADPFTVVCASVWRPHKRLRACIQGFLGFHQRRADSRLWVIGPTDRAARDVIAHPAIDYLGALDHAALAHRLRQASVFLHLAWLDWCPNVVLEAQVCGLPVVCANGGGTKELLVRHTGAVIPCDPETAPPTETNIYDITAIPTVPPGVVGRAIDCLADDLDGQRERLLRAREGFDIARAGDGYLSLFESFRQGLEPLPRDRRFWPLAWRALRRRFGR